MATIETTGETLDLSGNSTSYTNINVVFGTTFLINQVNLTSGCTLTGNPSGTNAVKILGTVFDLTSTTLSNISILGTGHSAATTFMINQSNLVNQGAVCGSYGNDILMINGTSLDLRSTAISSIEILSAGNASSTTFRLGQRHLLSGGSISGSTGQDIISTGNTYLDLTSTVLSGIEVLTNVNPGFYFVNHDQLISGGSVTGGIGTQGLIVNATHINLTSTTLTGVEILRGATLAAMTFTVNQDNLNDGGTVSGSAGTDILTINGTSLDLRSTAISSIEVINTHQGAATTFRLGQRHLLSGGSISGSTGSTYLVDILATGNQTFDLSSTTISSIDLISSLNPSSSLLILSQNQMISGGSVFGLSGIDTLKTAGTLMDLTSTSLSGIDVLTAGGQGAYSFIVNQEHLISGGWVSGGSGTDTLSVADIDINLNQSYLQSVEIIKAGLSDSTTFHLRQRHLASGGSIVGSQGEDTLMTDGFTLDLRAVTLSSIEYITTSRIDYGTLFGTQGDDVINGNNGNDTLKGSFGNDTVNGGAGNDLVAGQEGTDVLTGGGGKDQFFFNITYQHSTLSNPDEVTDYFGNGEDKIYLAGGGGSFASTLDPTTLQNAVSQALTLSDALNTAASLNTTDKGVMFFNFNENTYVYREETGSATQYVSTDLVVNVLGLKTLTFQGDIITG